jgi:hypothetical protein
MMPEVQWRDGEVLAHSPAKKWRDGAYLLAQSVGEVLVHGTTMQQRS